MDFYPIHCYSVHQNEVGVGWTSPLVQPLSDCYVSLTGILYERKVSHDTPLILT